ncbi:MAG: glycosyltransferase family 4 protein [Cyclobacteriaceae bacterium]|nr:glycosyltransferase family 4 protein [Cyclobacteriaceae bacterium]
MIKVTYILSLIFKSLEYEWIVRYLDKSKIELSFVLLNPVKSELEEFLIDNDIEVTRITFKGKISYPKALFQTYRILRRINPDYINCNLLDANLIGLTAGYFAGVKNRIHTRHHSTFHHVYFPKGKIYDYYSSFLSTEIVAVSSLVKKVLVEKEGVLPVKVRVIPHGFGLEDFNSVSKDRVKHLKEKYNIGERSPIIGVISRYIEWKGVQYIVPAFKEVLINYPNAILLIANARQGKNTANVIKLLKEIPAETYREIEFESDIIAYYKLLDVFIHTPIDDHSEAFGRIYPESLASGVPLVCTISGIAHDIIKHDYNALVVPHQNSHEIANAVNRILSSESLRQNISNNARETAKEYSDMKIQKRLLEDLYLGK